MPIDFPNSPTLNDTYSAGGKTWYYDGTGWTLRSVLTANGTIATSDLANSAVTSAKIADGTIATGDIADDAIETAKIANSAVTATKLATDSVVEHNIVNNAVTTGKLGTDVQLGYRNVIINGAMQVAQRGTSKASITTSGYYTADRWNHLVGSMGTWTQSVENDAPTGSGLRKSLKILCTTADAAPAAGDVVTIRHYIEGQNVQQFLKGTASAKPFTMSFWVKSNVTGTYIVRMQDADNNRSVSASYTVSASATWEKKTITLPADTTGVFDNDNAGSLIIDFALGAGSDRTSGTLSTVWASTVNANALVGQTNVAAATNNYFQITGVQLEAGSVATPFEFEDYGVTWAKCQRYFQQSIPATGVANGSTTIVAPHAFPTIMRAAPSVSSTGVLAMTDGYAADVTQSSVSTNIVAAGRVTAFGMHVAFANFSGLVVGRVYTSNVINSNVVTFSAEL